jgi:hypothetical protein
MKDRDKKLACKEKRSDTGERTHGGRFIRLNERVVHLAQTTGTYVYGKPLFSFRLNSPGFVMVGG